MPFDRNQAGLEAIQNRVIKGTLAKGRQIKFFEQLLASMETVPENTEFVRVRMDARDFHEGVVRITKGLLYTFHPGIKYHESKFNVVDIHPEPFDEQLKLMAMLKQAQYFERGERVFQCWRHVEEAQQGGAWMLVFYECFGFFVFHTKGSELDRSDL